MAPIRLTWAAGIVAAMAVIAGLWLTTEAGQFAAAEPTVHRQLATASEAPARALHTPAPAGNVAPGNTGSTQASAPAAWAGLLARGADLRHLALQALSAPTQGGLLYARAVARLCAGPLDRAGSAERFDREGEPAKDLDVNVPVQQAAVARLALLKAQCSQFSADELESLLHARDDDPAASPDPLMAASARLRASTDDSSRRAALAELLARPDPLMLDHLRGLLVIRSDDADAVYFDGIRYEGADSQLIAAALELLPCAFGWVCDGGAVDLALDCNAGFECHSDRFERVKARYAEGDEARYRTILSLYTELTAAVRAGDVERFVARP